MKKAVTIILIITLILAFVGCKKIDNTSSESDISSEPIISSNRENVVSIEDNTSDITVTSSEESKKNSSAVTPSTNVNSTEKTVSKNNDTPSQTIIKNKQSTFFEKHNLKLLPLTTNVCFNTEAGHICGTHKTITFVKDKLENLEWLDTYSDYIKDGQIDVSKYKYIMIETGTGAFYDDYSECFKKYNHYYVFDKYTGIVFNDWVWTEILYKEKNCKIIKILDGGNAGYYEESIYCPEDYDGAVFLMTESYNYNKLNDGKSHTIDEFIDFENDKYYLFAANN